MSAWAVGGFLLTLIVVPLVVNEAGELAPWLAGRMVQWAAGLLGTPEARERYAEEWAANLERVPGKLTKLAWACGLLVWGAPHMRVQIRSRKQTAAPSQSEARDDHISFRTRGYNLLIDLSDAQRDILKLTPSERGKFQSLGLAILITSLAAMISMWFALSSALGVNGILAVPIAALWGLVIMGIDRWQVASMPARGSRKFAVEVPRILLAIVFGALISIPLVLRFLQPQINWQLSVMRAQSAASALQQNSAVHQVGLLARLQALGSLSTESPAVSTGCILFFVVFMFFGCLPMALRLLQRPGQYEAAVVAAKRAERRENRRDGD